MSRFKTAILILGMLAVIMAVSLATFIALSFSGVIVTDPVKLTFSVNDNSKIYDGQPLTPNGYSLTDGELFNGHRPEVKYTGSQVQVGESLGGMEVKILDEKDCDVTGEYSITVIECQLVVEKCNLMVYLNGSQAVYSGNKVIFDDYTLTAGSLADGHCIGASIAGAGAIEVDDILTSNSLYPAVYDGAGRNVSDNYNIAFVMDEVRVVPRPITIRPVGAEKVYDGKAMTCERYEIVSGSLAEGQYAEVTYVNRDGGEPAIRNVGEITLTANVKIRDVNGKDVTSNYAVNVSQTAVLKVTPRELILTAMSRTWEYDGNAHSLSDYSTPYSAVGLVNGEEVIVEYGDEITDCGVAVNGIKSYSITNGNSNYNVTPISGTLTVTPAKLTVGGEITKSYGSDVCTVEYTGVPNGMAFSSNAKDVAERFTDAGSYSCAVTDYSIYKDGKDVTGNYTLTVNPFVLNISPCAVSVELNALEYTKQYNGLPFAFGETDLTVTGLLNGHRVSSFTNTQIINAGNNQNCALTSLNISDGSGVDVTRNYSFELPSAQVTVTKMTVNVGINNKVITYGDEVGNLQSLIIGAENLEGEFTFGDYSNLDAGTHMLSATYEGNDVNYNVVVGTGTLTVNKKQVNVSIIDSSKPYDGKPVELDDIYFTSDLTGLKIVDSNLTAVKDAGTYPAAASFAVYEGVANKTSNYDIIVTPGEFEIEPCKVTLGYIGATSKVYDGTPFTVNGADVTANMDGLTVTAVTLSDSVVTPRQSKRITITPAFALNGEPVSSNNFSFNELSVNVTIEQKKIALPYLNLVINAVIGENFDAEDYVDDYLDSNNVSKSYTNSVNALFADGDRFEKDLIIDVDADSFGVMLSLSLTNAKIINSKGEDVTACYDFSGNGQINYLTIGSASIVGTNS